MALIDKDGDHIRASIHARRNDRSTRGHNISDTTNEEDIYAITIREETIRSHHP